MATVFTTVGKQWTVDKWDESVSTLPNKLGWGTGAGTAAVGDTTLFTEDSGGSPTYARVTCTLTQPAADTLQMDGTITANGTKTITNMGVFDAATSGVLIVKADFSGVPVLLNDSIQGVFTLQET